MKAEKFKEEWGKYFLNWGDFTALSIKIANKLYRDIQSLETGEDEKPLQDNRVLFRADRADTDKSIEGLYCKFRFEHGGLFLPCIQTIKETDNGDYLEYTEIIPETLRSLSQPKQVEPINVHISHSSEEPPISFLDEEYEPTLTNTTIEITSTFSDGKNICPVQLKVERCKWTIDEDLALYKTECGVEHFYNGFETRMIHNGNFKGCPYCIKPIELVKE